MGYVHLSAARALSLQPGPVHGGGAVVSPISGRTKQVQRG